MKLSTRMIIVNEKEPSMRVLDSNWIAEVVNLETVVEMARKVVRTAKGNKDFPMVANVPAIRINLLQAALEELEE